MFRAASKRARGVGLRHGTHVASLIFGQHDGPVRGVAPKCRGVVIPIYGEQDDGSLVPCSQMDLARAISLAVAVGANVINISAGVYDETGEPEPPLARAIRLCEDQGILIVAAAGNEGCACPHVPAASPTVLAVGAADGTGNPLGFSNWSELYRGHGVLAPGDDARGRSTGRPDTVGPAEPAWRPPWCPASRDCSRAGSCGSAETLTFERSRRRSSRAPSVVKKLRRPTANARWAAGWTRVHAFALISQGEASAMSNSNLPQTSVNSPCAQGLAGESVAAGWGKSRRSERRPRPRATICRLAGPTVPLPIPFETERRLVYALGQISFDFGTEARRDAFEQAGGEAVITDPGALLAFLQDKPWEATAVTWTLQQEATPIYALQPVGTIRPGNLPADLRSC